MHGNVENTRESRRHDVIHNILSPASCDPTTQILSAFLTGHIHIIVGRGAATW